MKLLFQVLPLSLITVISIAGTGLTRSADCAQPDRSTVNPLPVLAPNLNLARQRRRVLKIAVPESATVRLASGRSYTGQLSAFNAEHLTVSANGHAKTVPLSQLQQVEFQGSVWFSNTDGSRRRSRRIRGLGQTLEAVPVSALGLGNPPNSATLNLATVLKPQEFAQLTQKSDQIHAIQKIRFESANTMTVKIVAVKRL